MTIKGNKKSQVLISTLLTLCMFFGFVITANAAAKEPVVSIEEAIQATGKQLLEKVPNPIVGSTGGEWAVIGLARSGYAVPQSYYDTYYKNVVNTLKEKKGILTTNKYTEYSRVILALTAIGKDVTNVEGYNLLEGLADFENVKKQGINGPVFALIALDSHQYEIPAVSSVKTQNTRQMMVDYIISKEITDVQGTVGGFALSGNVPDADITAMVLQALSNYTDQVKVKEAVDRALVVLSNGQNKDGSFSSWNSDNAESICQVIVALSALNIDINTDNRFIKDGNWPVSALMDYYVSAGGFRHARETQWNGMATEQGLYALAAYDRYAKGNTSLYNMSDVTITTVTTPNQPDVKNQFQDITNHWAKVQIVQLANQGIVNGVTTTTFEPNRDMTRAEFTAILARAMKLKQETTTSYTDVSASAWYSGSIGAFANHCLQGETTTVFRPNDKITREEAAFLIARAAQASGIESTVTEQEAATLLAQYTDAANCSAAFKTEMAYNVKNAFLQGNDQKLLPQNNMTRAEAVTIIGRMLDKTGLMKK